MAYTDADIEELITRSKCYDVLTRYCRVLDRAVEGWFEIDTHVIYNVHMEIAGAVAYTESYLISYCTVPGEREKVEAVFGKTYASQFDWSKITGVTHDFLMGGRYIDRFERRGGEWRIAKRQVVMDWNRNEISRTLLDEGMFATLRPLGERGKGDPVYANRPASVRA